MEFLDRLYELNAKLEDQNSKIEALTKRVISIHRDLILGMPLGDFFEYCHKYDLDPSTVIDEIRE